jgi:serine/threonine protein kinase
MVPEFHRWMANSREPSYFLGDPDSSPLNGLESPHQVDLWSFAVTLYAIVTGSPLFPNRYDRASVSSLVRLRDWDGLTRDDISDIEDQHGASESAALRDLLLWALDAHARNRPKSVSDLTSHAFFDPHKGAMRVNFVVEQIKSLLAAERDDRIDVNVMISYCWADTDFVLSRLAMELAPHVKELWLDRLGGENGTDARCWSGNFISGVRMLSKTPASAHAVQSAHV